MFEEECVTVFEQNCRVLDLGYEMNEGTIFWPGGEGFKLCINHCGEDKDFYAAGSFSCAEHGGTHVDAPWHFYEHGITVERITLKQLIGVCRVISTNQTDIVAQDIINHEEMHGILPENCIVVCNTNWANNYSQGVKLYLGFDDSQPYCSETSSLKFPGISADAARLLVDRHVSAVGIDTASLDPGQNKNFDAHKILLSSGVYGIENLNSQVNSLPPRGATLMVMPLKLTGGSGAPARVVGFVPQQEKGV